MRKILLLFSSAFTCLCICPAKALFNYNKEAIKEFALASQSIDEHLYDDAIMLLEKPLRQTLNLLKPTL
jgi:hypothetical protein